MHHHELLRFWLYFRRNSVDGKLDTDCQWCQRVHIYSAACHGNYQKTFRSHNPPVAHRKAATPHPAEPTHSPALGFQLLCNPRQGSTTAKMASFTRVQMKQNIAWHQTASGPAAQVNEANCAVAEPPVTLGQLTSLKGHGKQA